MGDVCLMSAYDAAVPLELNDRSIDRYADRAWHRQLADIVRAQIKSGQLRPGEALPSEQEISDRAGLSRTAVRDALAVLVGEGLVTKRTGMPSRVAAPPPVRHMATSRYRDELEILRKLDGGEHPLTSAFVVDHGVGWDEHQIEAVYIKDIATAEDAERLDVAEGSPVLRRQLVKIVAGEPVQVQESVLPLPLVEDTPVEDPSRQPWPGGTIAELHSIRHPDRKNARLVVTRVVEEASTRTPTTAERKTLQMEAAGRVWEIIRTFYAAFYVADEPIGPERPVEASTVVAPAARMRLRFETDLRT
jgi:GntR family transcriptional regulator